MRLDGAARRALEHLRAGVPLEESLRRGCEAEGERAREMEVALRGLLSDRGKLRGQAPEEVLERVASGSALGDMRDPRSPGAGVFRRSRKDPGPAVEPERGRKRRR